MSGTGVVNYVNAQDIGGAFRFRSQVGPVLAPDHGIDLTTLPPALTFPFKAGTDTGFAGGGAIGLEVPWGGLLWRPEFEITYSSQDFDSYRSNSGNFVGTGVGGSMDVTTYMANVTVGAPIRLLGSASVMQVPTGLFVTPYVGGGIGVANVDADLTTSNGNLLPPILLPGQQFTGSDTAFAYNLRGGIEFCWTSTCSFKPFVEYRYTSIQDVSLGTSQPLLAPNVGMEDISQSSIMVGAIFNLWTWR